MKEQKNILIVEDDKKLQIALKIKLESLGWKVLQAFNGLEGLDFLEKEKIDLVLLDIAMPVMNGYEMLVEMEKKGKLAGTKVIILSNSSYAPLRSKEAEKLLEGIEYLIKSNYTLNEIVNKIKKILQ